MNAIAPGPFPTPGAWDRLMPDPRMQKAAINRIPLRRVGQHEELANLAAYLVADGSGYINGEVVTIDGGEWLKGAGEFTFLEGAQFAESIEANSVHGSDSPENAAIEIAFFFAGTEIVG